MSLQDSSVDLASEIDSADYDSSTTMSAAVSVDQAQLESVRNHLLSANANFLAPRLTWTASASNVMTDQTAVQPRQSIFRRFNIFAPSAPTEDEKSIETDDQLTTLATTELDGMEINEKRTYFELRKLRELPKVDRHLFWEEREDHYSYYPLPEQPEAKLIDDESGSYTSGTSYTSSTSNDPTNMSQSQSLVSALTPVHKLKAIRDGTPLRGVTEKRSALTPLDQEIRIVQYIQAQKRKTFNENCILTAHGVRVLPSYLKRPSGEPGCRSLEEQQEEDERNRRDNADWGGRDYTIAELSPVRKIRFNMNSSSPTMSVSSPTMIRSSLRGASSRAAVASPVKNRDNLPSLRVTTMPTSTGQQSSPTHKKVFKGQRCINDNQEDVPVKPLIQAIAPTYSYSEERLRKENETFSSLSRPSSRPTTLTSNSSLLSPAVNVNNTANRVIDPNHHQQPHHHHISNAAGVVIDNGTIGGRININAIRSFHNSWM